MAMRLLNPASLIQAAIPSIFKNVPQSFLSETMEVFESNAKTSYSIFSKVPGLNPVMPAGAMYIMVRQTASLKWTVPRVLIFCLCRLELR